MIGFQFIEGDDLAEGKRDVRKTDVILDTYMPNREEEEQCGEDHCDDIGESDECECHV